MSNVNSSLSNIFEISSKIFIIISAINVLALGYEGYLLYVKYGIQAKGIGKMIWNEIEKLHPDTIMWETCTPWFEKRNIHFYVNKCKFHIVKYEREINEEGFIGDGGDGMFIFQKVMK